MVKQSSVVQKAEIAVECAKYTDMPTGRIVKNGVEAIKRHDYGHLASMFSSMEPNLITEWVIMQH
jgi:hypothetical protein